MNQENRADSKVDSDVQLRSFHAESLLKQIIQGNFPYESFPLLDFVIGKEEPLSSQKLCDLLPTKYFECTMNLIQTILVNANVHCELASMFRSSVRTFLENGNGYSLLQMDQSGHPVHKIRAMIDLLIAYELVQSPVVRKFPVLFEGFTEDVEMYFSLARLLLFVHLRSKESFLQQINDVAKSLEMPKTAKNTCSTFYDQMFVDCHSVENKMTCTSYVLELHMKNILENIVRPFSKRLIVIMTWYDYHGKQCQHGH